MKPILWDGSEEARQEVQLNFTGTCFQINGDELWFFPWTSPSHQVKLGDKIYKDADGEPYIFNKGGE